MLRFPLCSCVCLRRAAAFLAVSLPLGFSPATARSETADEAFRRVDRDGDGKVTRAELPQRLLFKRFDGNGDGTITLEETRAAFGAEDAEAAVRGLKGPVEALFKGADKDGDGVLTAAEVSKPKLFALLDRDADGSVQLEEAKAAILALREGKGLDGLVPPATEPPHPVRTSGPEVTNPGEAGIGRQVPDIGFADLAGRTHRLGEIAAASEGVAIAMTSTTCPVSLRYAPALARLEKDLAARGVAFILVNPFASEKPEDLAAAVKRHGFSGPYVHDSEEAFASSLGARTTTEVFLIDPARTLVYRGALDDRYGVDYSRDEPRETYLLDAVTAMLGNARPRIAATLAPGCELDLAPAPAEAADPGEVTYHRDVSRILRQNCLECHHESGIAPFALDDFAEVDDRAKVIRRVIEEGTMPPWFAAAPKAGESSPWANDRSLSARDRRDLLAWLSSTDRPMGDPAEAPAPLAFSGEGWTLGEPDAVFAFDKPVPVQAEGQMPYVNLVVPTHLTGDRWIRGFEILPGAREVVHHVIVFAVDPENPNERFSEIGGYYALYVPGTSGEMFPAGMAKKLPAGAKLRFQMHYTPNGTATEDLTRIGFFFADEEPRYEVKVASVANTRISIPAGAPNHQESAERPVPSDMTVLGFLPHLHTRGKAFRYEIDGAEGTTTLLDVPRYDFNWQLYYRLKEPIHLPRGTRVRATAWYDNSAANQANPDPTRTVKWGRQTDDEMMIGYIEYYEPVERPTPTEKP